MKRRCAAPGSLTEDGLGATGESGWLSQGSINPTRLDKIQFNATAVPEPAIALLLAFGAGAMAFRRRRITGT